MRIQNKISTFFFFVITSHVVAMEDDVCTICRGPYEFNNGKFKVEITNKKFAKDHRIHESNFHKLCIEKWMEYASSCPICRQILVKGPFSNLVQKQIKTILSILHNPAFWIFLFDTLFFIFIMKRIGLRIQVWTKQFALLSRSFKSLKSFWEIGNTWLFFKILNYFVSRLQNERFLEILFSRFPFLIDRLQFFSRF